METDDTSNLVGARCQADVQAKIRAIPGLDSRAILVGHSLNCDLEVLQWQHDRIVDTAALFPHHKGERKSPNVQRLLWVREGTKVFDIGETFFSKTLVAWRLLHVHRWQACLLSNLFDIW